jgi:hypothetical protein
VPHILKMFAIETSLVTNLAPVSTVPPWQLAAHINDYHVLNNLLREHCGWRAGASRRRFACNNGAQWALPDRGAIANANATAFEHYVDGPSKVFHQVDGRFEYAVPGGNRAQHAADAGARGGRAVDPGGIRVVHALRHWA